MDSAVSNLAAVRLEWSAQDMENMVSILAEVETLHLAGEQQKRFRYEARMCAVSGMAVQTHDEHTFTVRYRGEEGVR